MVHAHWLSCVAATVLIPSALAQSQTLYEPLAVPSVGAGKEVIGGDAIRHAIAATDWPEEAPLLEGWISTSIWTRLYSDQQIFLVKREPPLAADQGLCRVTVREPLTPGGNADASAGIARIGWGCETKREDDVRAASVFVISPGPRTGPVVAETTSLRARDGSLLKVEHVTNIGIAHPPLPPVIRVNRAAFGRLPASREFVSDPALSTYFVRVQSDGQPRRWGLAFKYGRLERIGRSGCYVTRADGSATVPNEGWLTTAVRDWCRARQQAWSALQPPEPAPMLPSPSTTSPRGDRR